MIQIRIGTRASIAAAFLVFSLRATYLAAASANDLDMVRDQLRKAHKLVSSKDGENLGRIGMAQVQLRDLTGALKTFDAIKSSQRREANEFVAALAASQAGSGEAVRGLQTVESVPWIDWNFNHCRAILSVAQEAAKGGFKQISESAIARSLEISMRMDDSEKHIVLYEIGLAQLATNFPEQAKATYHVLENLTEHLKNDDQTLARSLCRMGLFSAKLSDPVAAKRYFERARKAIDIKALGGSDAHEWIAASQAETGDVDAAMSTALAIPAEFPMSAQRDGALHGIAMCQLSMDDRAGAEKTAQQIHQFLQYHSSALIAIAESHARIGASAKAIDVASQITNSSRKAEAMLQIAAALAERGDLKSAMQIADGLTYPETQDDLLGAVASKRRFIFREPATWGEHYEQTSSFTMASYFANSETAADLTAAAMHCRVAIDGIGDLVYSPMLKDWDVRKLAKSQAISGDASGAMGWITCLPEQERLEALLGMADGLAHVLKKGQK